MTLALRGWYPRVSGLIEVEVREGMATDLGGYADLSLCTVAGGRRLGTRTLCLTLGSQQPPCLWGAVSFSSLVAF